MFLFWVVLGFFIYIGHDWNLLSFEDKWDKFLSTFTYLNLETGTLICNPRPFNWKNSHQLKVKGNKVKCKENQTSMIIYQYTWHHHIMKAPLIIQLPHQFHEDYYPQYIPLSGWLRAKAPRSQHESYWCITGHVKNLFSLRMQPVNKLEDSFSSGI